MQTLSTSKTRVGIETLIWVADLAGTFVFAVEGAVTAMRGGLDLLGVMVVAFVAALGGGVIRDLLIGATPPSAISDWRYPALTFAAGLFAFLCHALVQSFPPGLMTVLDAAGLALFAVAGVEKALLYKIRPFVAMLMGTITGVGGGVIRDILLTRVPLVLRADVYASAAFVGALVVVVARRAGVPPGWAAMLGGLACFVLRMVAVTRGWQLPKAVG
ncbi:trimeric intracellular cation channel family protein [Paraburkholderia sp. DHOC27]|uniref:trimeric intracellular cation channel family protein n=1 Tax=Paraburkholderia sp. DHOC27 TaxID=2303330 RepID=UPI000E3EC9DC|nr:TRIC cation channel family protein [Paraburkholderia sp. DHOC27]RFU47869.1 trimeric intracellular cation channel family protein [Paraburkholderia sp. DHOC27]